MYFSEFFVYNLFVFLGYFFKMMVYFVVLFALLADFARCGDTLFADREIDTKGYVMFCPCMGRFGNQADQFLGSLLFAKSLDRTLILPPFVEYPPGSVRSVQVPFDRYFKVDNVASYHRVVLMHDFMKFLAPTVWPKGKRVAFCYSERPDGKKPHDCNAREGNPFDSFWATFDVDFDSSEFFQPLYYNAELESAAKEWKWRFPVEKFPVLAFTGAPSPYPPQPAALPLQRHIFQFSDFITFKAQSFIKENIRRPFVGIHLRNGIDWKNACEHVKSLADKNHHMFDSAQCLGQNFERGKLKYDLCFPSEKTVAAQVAKAVKKYKAQTVFVATDNDDLKNLIRSEIRAKNLGFEVTIVRNPDSQDHILDLALLGEADFYIGNCLSSFSQFAIRYRKANGKPSQHFGIKEDVVISPRDEL